MRLSVNTKRLMLVAKGGRVTIDYLDKTLPKVNLKDFIMCADLHTSVARQRERNHPLKESVKQDLIHLNPSKSEKINPATPTRLRRGLALS